jgi:hypothetical protein
MNKQIKLFRASRNRRPYRPLACVLLLLSIAAAAHAQDATQGINQANSMVRGYFDVGITLMYAIGGVVGLIGAVKVYNAWSHGDQNTNKMAASWFGACIFLVVVAALLKSFFALT